VGKNNLKSQKSNLKTTGQKSKLGRVGSGKDQISSVNKGKEISVLR